MEKMNGGYAVGQTLCASPGNADAVSHILPVAALDLSSGEGGIEHHAVAAVQRKHLPLT
jgi:hypothetical protein